MRNIEETVSSQYQTSPSLLALVRGFNGLIDPETWIQDFYKRVFNVYTAEGWGLDVWGQIVAIKRSLELEGPDWKVFGFKGQDCTNFNNGPFYNRQVTNTYVLQDNSYRLLIMCKAASNITDGTLADLNKIVNNIFKEQGRAVVLHIGTMKIRFLLYFHLTYANRALLLRDDVPPKPAGVGFDIYEIKPPITFGFKGTGGANFNRGVFQLRGPQDAYTVNS